MVSIVDPYWEKKDGDSPERVLWSHSGGHFGKIVLERRDSRTGTDFGFHLPTGNPGHCRPNLSEEDRGSC